MKQLKGYLFIAVAATLWGASATMVKHLFNIQYPPLIIVQTRVSIAFIVLAVFFLITNPRILAFRMRDIPHFFVVGVCGIAGSNYFYYFAIKESNVATAIVVQYSAPIMVALYAIVVQHEKMTRYKLLSLVCSTVGIFLAVGGLNGLLVANHKGIVLALAAAVSYAIFNIAGKPLTKKYSVWSVAGFHTWCGNAVLAAGAAAADDTCRRIFVCRLEGVHARLDEHQSWFHIYFIFLDSSIFLQRVRSSPAPWSPSSRLQRSSSFWAGRWGRCRLSAQCSLSVLSFCWRRHLEHGRKVWNSANEIGEENKENIFGLIEAPARSDHCDGEYS